MRILNNAELHEPREKDYFIDKSLLLFFALGVGPGPGPGPGPGGKSPCHPNPCMNGGSCTENGGGYDCSCTTQFSGPNCESKYSLLVVHASLRY